MREISVAVGRSNVRRQVMTFACPFCMKIFDPIYFYPHDATQTLGQMLIIAHLNATAGYPQCKGDVPAELTATAGWPDRRRERWHLWPSERRSELLRA